VFRDEILANLIDLFSHIIRDENLMEDTYFVGGTVRDILLGKDIRDIDIAMKGNIDDLGRRFADTIHGSYVVLNERFQTIRIVKDGYIFDLTSMHGDTIHKDLMKRDFTINALAMPFKAIHMPSISGEIIDYSGGREDLRKGVIRMVSTENLLDDPLRILRAYRFSTELGFRIESNTLKTAESMKSLIKNVASERILYEMKVILMNDHSYRNIGLMAKGGLLFEIIPELEDLRGIEQGFPHTLDVFNHSLIAYNEAERIIEKPEMLLPYPSEHREYLEVNQYRKAFLKLSVLLHDMGKAKTREVMPDGRIAFQKHECIGAEIARDICSRLKASRKECDFVYRMVLYHMEMLLFRDLSKRTMVRFLRGVHDDLYGLIIMGLSDKRAMAGTRGDERENSFMKNVKKIIEFYLEEFKPKMAIPRFLTGRDLINVFGLTPSPLFSDILAMIEEKTLEGEIDSREKALLEVERFLEKRIHG